MIDIKGISKAVLLHALHKFSEARGRGVFHDVSDGLSPEQCEEILAGHAPSGTTHGYRNPLYFDYLAGRPLKVDIGSDSLDERLYDRDNGHGRCALAVAYARTVRA